MRYDILLVRVLMSCFLLGSVLFPCRLQAASEPWPHNRVVLTDNDADQVPGLRLALLEDPQGSLTLADVRSSEWRQRFVLSTKAVPSFGFTPSSWWVWFRVDRQTSRESQWLLEFGYPPMQHVDVHVVRSDGSVAHQAGGSAVPVPQRPFDYHTHVFPLDVPAIEEKLRQSGRQEPGEIRLTSTLEGEWLRISVTDSGTGMPEHVKNRLFEPFFTTKGSERGTGLGMGICKGIMESHGGRLEVESMPGVGTTITVVLPLYQA